MRKKLALLMLALSAAAAASFVSPPLKASCILHECPSGEVVLCCSQPCCPPEP